jgi:ligand-binding sensor domain-containing protein
MTGRIDAFLTATLALKDGALVRRASSSWTAALSPSATTQTLSDRNISALAFDSSGRLYIGFFDHGLDELDPQTSRMEHLEDDALFCINRLVLDPRRQTIAAATADGVVLFDAAGVPRQTLTRRDGLLSDHVTDIAFTRSGTVLATPAGLTFITPAGTDSLYAFQGLVNNHVYALAATPASDQVLAGTLGGISVLEAEAVRRNLTVTNSGLKHNWITALAALPGSQDTLIGTYGAGLQRLAPSGAVTQIDLPAGAPHDLVINPNALLATPSHVYAGTLGHGMLAYTNATGRWSLMTEGLPSLNVTAFAIRAGELYIGTESGLIRTHEASLP